jgi:membrane fusion protein, multidrug efflux system
MHHLKEMARNEFKRGLRPPLLRLALISCLSFYVSAGFGIAQSSPDLNTSNLAAEFSVPVYGRFSSKHDVTLSARRSGVILLPNTEQRGSIKQGEMLFEIECDVEKAQREIYAATLRQAELEQVSREQLQKYSATTDLEVAKSRTAVERANAELLVYESVLDRCKQTAPFSGIVVDQFIQHQEYAREGDAVLHLVDPNDIVFEFLAPAIWVDKIAEGGTILVKVDAQVNPIHLIITHITPIIDAVGQTFKVYALDTAENEARIRVGMVGLVTLEEAP